MSARMQFCGRFPGLRAVSGIWSGAAADSLSLGSKRNGRIRLQKTQPKRRRFETVCRSLQKDAGRSLLRSIAPGWTGLCGRKVCSRAWCPAIARWADARQKGILNCSVYNSSILLVLFLTNANNSIICQLFSCRYIPHLLQSEYECCHNGRRLVLLQRLLSASGTRLATTETACRPVTL